MQLFETKKDLINFIENQKNEGLSIGLVPTMGALHEGHLSLAEEAFRHVNLVVVSIFVNPTQFNNSADLEKYPRSVEEDVALLQKNYPDIIVYCPVVEDIYEESVSSESFNFGTIANEMEGKYRAGHFDGVGTVLKKLFNIVNPNKAFFGEKDFQQLQIVKKLVELTGQPVEIIGCPISRETNGLARSSRNKRLSQEAQSYSSFIYKTLKEVKNKFGTINAKELTQWAKNEFKKNALLSLEYFQISDENTLKPIEVFEKNKNYRAFVAVYAEDVRLIDNIALS